MFSHGAIEDLASPSNEEKAGDVAYIERIPTSQEDTDGRKVTIKTQDSRFGEYLATHKTNPLSKSLLTLYPILVVVCMTSAANGFDGNTFGGASSMPDFQARFGTNVASSQRFLAALYILGKSAWVLIHRSTDGGLHGQCPWFVPRWSSR